MKQYVKNLWQNNKPSARQEMISYLSSHFRYYTMNSWNGVSSYAVNVKVHNLIFADRDSQFRAFDLIDTKGAYVEIDSILHEFALRYDHAFQIGWNGRSSGYLVLYQGYKKQSAYKSYCAYCGQRNFKCVYEGDIDAPRARVLAFALKHPTAKSFDTLAKNWPTELEKTGVPFDEAKQYFDELASERENCTLTSRCGRCHEEGRINYETPLIETYIQPGQGLDESEDLREWTTDSLRDRVNLVWDFDKTVNKAAKAYVDYCKTHKAEQREIMVPQTITVAARL
jgi:hypothetical protein